MTCTRMFINIQKVRGGVEKLQKARERGNTEELATVEQVRVSWSCCNFKHLMLADLISTSKKLSWKIVFMKFCNIVLQFSLKFSFSGTSRCIKRYVSYNQYQRSFPATCNHYSLWMMTWSTLVDFTESWNILLCTNSSFCSEIGWEGHRRWKGPYLGLPMQIGYISL